MGGCEAAVGVLIIPPISHCTPLFPAVHNATTPHGNPLHYIRIREFLATPTGV